MELPIPKKPKKLSEKKFLIFLEIMHFISNIDKLLIFIREKFFLYFLLYFLKRKHLLYFQK